MIEPPGQIDIGPTRCRVFDQIGNDMLRRALPEPPVNNIAHHSLLHVHRESFEVFPFPLSPSNDVRRQRRRHSIYQTCHTLPPSWPVNIHHLADEMQAGHQAGLPWSSWSIPRPYRRHHKRSLRRALGPSVPPGARLSNELRMPRHDPVGFLHCFRSAQVAGGHNWRRASGVAELGICCICASDRLQHRLSII